MFHKKLSLRILAAVFAAFLVLPTAAQGVFAATDPQITVIVEMKSEPLFAQDAVLQLNSEAQQNYSEKTGTERDKVLARAEKSVGSLEVKYTYADVFNGAAVTIRESELKELKKVSGVAKVYEPAKVKLITDDIDDETLEAFNQRASEMIGLASAREQGYEGEGTLVAIIDGGFETKHENFQPLDSTDNKLSRADVIDTIKSGALSSSTIRSSAYVSSKIPYFHSYAIDSSKGEPLLNAEPDHGTHVAGIAAGNGPAMQGVAPKAQLAMLQVSFESDEAYISDVVAAINDAVTLGADAMNISLGENWKDAKFEAYEPMTKAVENARNAGVLVACAAGNEGSLLTETDNPYYATDCFPSTAPGATSIGAGNSDSVSTLSNATISFKGETLEYLTVADGYAHNGSFEIAAPLKLGAMAARVTVSLKKNGLAGKFVPITKSIIGFEQDELMHQISLLAESDLAACLLSRSLYDQLGESLIFYMFFYYMPAILVLDDADFDAVAAGGTLSVTEGFPEEMAYFSSWCFDRDLENGVDFSAPGTHIQSSVAGNRYEEMGGTSMATPYACGASALMSERINRSGVKLGGGARVQFMENALKNTAAPYVDEHGEYLSPRLQGAGLMNIGAALQNEAALTDALRSGEAEIHLGTALNEKFSFSVKLTNRSNADKTYDLSAAFNTDSSDEYDDYDETIAIFEPNERVALKAAVTGLDKPVTVKAGGSEIVDVSVALDAEQVASLSETFSNGFYVDGFVVAKSGDEVLGIPLTGFYGDYYALPAMEDDRSVSFSLDGEGVRIYISSVLRVSLSKAQAVLTDEEGIEVWRSELTDLWYPFGLSFSNEEEEVPILGLSEGTYHLTLTVLPAARGAREQTYEEDVYFPGTDEPEIVSWEMTPDGDGYRVSVISTKKDLDFVEMNGVTFKTMNQNSWAELELEEKTEEGYLYSGYVYTKAVKNPEAHYDITFYNTVGTGRTYYAPVDFVWRSVVAFIGRMLSVLFNAVFWPIEMLFV